MQAYSHDYGDVTWDEADWAVVVGAGALATLVEIILVRIPRGMKFPREGTEHAGSPLTKWLDEHSEEVHREFLKRFEKTASVPYDAVFSRQTDYLVSGLAPRNHRLVSPGHDPLAAFFFGVCDLMRATGTYFDQGRLVRVPSNSDPIDLIEAVLTQVRHLLSDVATPAGLPPPLFTLLQLVTAESPFVRKRAGAEVKASWAEISRHMYSSGYDLRHYATMGLAPGVIEAMIRGYWHLSCFARGIVKERQPLERAKLASMLLFGHSLATSGMLLKTGLIYGMNPLALNLKEIQALAPAAITWLAVASARDRRVSRALESKWRLILADESI